MQKRIDWDAKKNTAQAMSTEQLFSALADIRETLPSADALDRANGSDDGGYYRDEASVYRTELATRNSRDDEAKRAFFQAEELMQLDALTDAASSYVAGLELGTCVDPAHLIAPTHRMRLDTFLIGS